MKTYMGALAEFWDFVDTENLDTSDDVAFDIATRTFANHLFALEVPLSQVEVLKAAIEACEPRYGRFGTYRLP